MIDISGKFVSINETLAVKICEMKRVQIIGHRPNNLTLEITLNDNTIRHVCYGDLLYDNSPKELIREKRKEILEDYKQLFKMISRSES